MGKPPRWNRLQGASKTVERPLKTLDIELGDEEARLLRARTLVALTGGARGAKEETLRVLDRAVSDAVSVARPRGAYRFASVKSAGTREISTPMGEIRSVKLALMARLASGDRQVVFTISTVGGAIEEALEAEAPLLYRFVLDAVGSQLAELVQEMVDETWLAEVDASGRKATMRMSPGYCDWGIEGQKILFRALDSSALGVRLTDRYLMVPRKSLSAAAVIADEVPVAVQCVTCSRNDCSTRRAPRDESAIAVLRGVEDTPVERQ